MGARLRDRYPSWFRYVTRDRADTPAVDFSKRVHPSSDGTADAPMDEHADRLFWRVALAIAVAGVVIVALAVAGR